MPIEIGKIKKYYVNNMLKNFSLIIKICLIIFYVVLTDSFAKNIQIGTSLSGYKYYKNEKDEGGTGTNSSFSLFSLNDKYNYALLEISVLCGEESDVRITRFYKPAKKIENDTVLETITLSTSRDKNELGDRSSGMSVLNNIKSAKRDINEIRPIDHIAPHLNKFCSSDGKIITPPVKDAERWLAVIDDVSSGVKLSKKMTSGRDIASFSFKLILIFGGVFIAIFGFVMSYRVNREIWDTNMREPLYFDKMVKQNIFGGAARAISGGLILVGFFIIFIGITKY